MIETPRCESEKVDRIGLFLCMMVNQTKCCRQQAIRFSEMRAHRRRKERKHSKDGALLPGSKGTQGDRRQGVHVAATEERPVLCAG